jgi:hypothetical protein
MWTGGNKPLPSQHAALPIMFLVFPASLSKRLKRTLTQVFVTIFGAGSDGLVRKWQLSEALSASGSGSSSMDLGGLVIRHRFKMLLLPLNLQQQSRK